MPKLIALFLFFFSAAFLMASDTAVKPTTENGKIEALLASIGSQANVKFIRNGREYDNATAAKFLRTKWERQRADIATAREFIDKIASRSSTTGQAYRIRLADGKEIDSAAFLSNRLAELDSK